MPKIIKKKVSWLGGWVFKTFSNITDLLFNLHDKVCFSINLFVKNTF